MDDDKATWPQYTLALDPGQDTLQDFFMSLYVRYALKEKEDQDTQLLQNTVSNSQTGRGPL